MSWADFAHKRLAIDAIVEGTTGETVGRYDQALAELYVQSGWTSQQLAAREGKAEHLIERTLRFGRFRAFLVDNGHAALLTPTLGDRRFHGYWDRTDTGASEEARFSAIFNTMRGELTVARPRRPKIGKKVIEKFGDGKWYRAAEIVDYIGAPDDQVVAMLELMRKNSTYNTKCEKKVIGGLLHYRMYPRVKPLDAKEVAEKLGPIIKGLKQEGKKNHATVSIGKVALLAAQLERLVDDWLV
jgi:hypothetical protein